MKERANPLEKIGKVRARERKCLGVRHEKEVHFFTLHGREGEQNAVYKPLE